MWKIIQLSLCCLAMSLSLSVATGCAGSNEHPPVTDLHQAQDTRPETAQGCSAQSCQGCCAGDTCRGGTALDACGRGGNPCVICNTDEACVQQSCVPRGPGCEAGCPVDARPSDGPARERAAHDGPKIDAAKKDRGPDLKCQDQCTLGGGPQCYGMGYRSCQSGSGGCTVWGPVTECRWSNDCIGQECNQMCSGGACVTIEFCLPKSAGQSCDQVCGGGGMTCRFNSQTAVCEYWGDCSSSANAGYCRCKKAP